MAGKSFESVVSIIERIAVIVKEIAEVIKRNIPHGEDPKDEKKEV